MHAAHETHVDRIVAKFALAISRGDYKSGQKLPSVRQAAQDEAVSKNTMAEAYDRLVARGSIKARAGSGYYVAHIAPSQAHTSKPHLACATDLISLLREQLEQRYEVRPGDGRPPTSWMEASELRHAFAKFKMTGVDALNFGYGDPRGYAPLRERLRLALAERSISVAPDDILLTHGANHALDLIIRHMLEPGDVVFVDDPGYYPLFAKLALAKVQTIGIKRSIDGPDLEDLYAKLKSNRPRAFFTQSQAHNPTGGDLSPSTAFGLLQAANQWDFQIVEDDPFADIIPVSAPRLAALDQLDRVVYIGTFSKTLSANLRCGFIAGKGQKVAALGNLKMVTVVTTSDYVERLVFSLIDGGHYLRHLRRLTKRLDEAYARSVAELTSIGLKVRANRIRGFYLWAEFPEGVNELDLCRRASEKGIFLAPGQVFYPSRNLDRTAAMRINIAHSDDRFLSFLKQAVASTPSPTSCD